MVPTYNNFAELSALLLMLKCVVSRNVSHLQIFCDSLLVINWIINLLLSLYDHIKQIETQLVFVSYSHVYRELNMQDDSLSKEALNFYSSIVVEVEDKVNEKLTAV
jgi:ribonuclease HI